MNIRVIYTFVESVLVALIIWFSGWETALAQGKRIALVMGNSAYEHVANLPNPANDASDIAFALESLGFKVMRGTDLDYREMRLIIRDFAQAAEDAEMLLIYFAGHGIEIGNTNYLIPVNAELQSDRDIDFEAIQLNTVINAVAGAAGLKVILVDACRNNPFLADMVVTSTTRSIGRGLGRIDPGAVLVGYAARSGTLALDGDGRNSPYAQALLKHITEPGLELGKMFRKVRDTVSRITDGYQQPFTYGSLPAADIYLAAPKPAGPSTGEILTAFVAADSSNIEADWREFIEHYDGLAAKDVIARARTKLAALERRGSAAPEDEFGIKSHVVAIPNNAEPSPLIRACDQLAGDPDDPDRPLEAAGVAFEQIDTGAAVTACTLATSGHMDNGRSHYQLARALVAAKSPDRATIALRRAVQLGHGAAGVFLGKKLLNEPGGLADAKEAIAILEDAVAGGNGLAARYLGDFFTNNGARFLIKGKTPVEYYQIAAASGDTVAQIKVGYQLISMPNASEEDRQQGVAWLEAAAAKGHQEVRLRLAKFYLSEESDGAIHSISRGIDLLHVAAEAGNAEAAVLLGRRYRLGDGVRADANISAEWISKAANHGHRLALVEQGFNFETGRGLRQNPAEAAAAYFEALTARSNLPYLRHEDEWPIETAHELQRLLRGSPKARYRGPIDGLVGPGTRAAIGRLCGCAEGWPVSFNILFRSAEFSGR